MTVYEKNRTSFELQFPEWLAEVEAYAEDNPEAMVIQEEIAYDGNVIFRVEKGERSLYLNGKYAPTERVLKWIDTIPEISTASVFVFVGIGSGIYLKELLKKCEKSVTIIIYEPSVHIFLKFLELVDLSEELEKHKFIFLIEGYNDDNYEYVISNFMTYDRLSYFTFFVHPNYAELFPESVLKCSKSANKIGEDLEVQQNTTIRFMANFADNLLSNMRYIPYHYKARQLGGSIPTDIPAIIISAGPSLNKNIKDLKKAKNKAFLIAVDTAVKPLLNNGIIPDVFVIVDGLKPVSLIEADGVSDVPLVTPFVAAKGVLEYHRGKKFFFEDGSVVPAHVYKTFGSSLEGVESGGSVANNAFSLAVLMGFKTIIFVGQDLAMTGNKSHADGTFADKMAEINTESDAYFEVESVDGGKVLTRFDFNRYRIWFEKVIERDGLDNVIDATEGGALIHGTKVMTLKEAIEKECKKEVDIKKLIDNIEPCFDKENQEKVIKYLSDLPQTFEKIKIEMRKARKEYEKIEKLCKKESFQQQTYIKKCKHVNKLVDDIIEKPETFIILESIRGIDYALRKEVLDTREDVQKEGVEVAQYGQYMLGCMEQCVDTINQHVTQLMDEFEENPLKFMPFEQETI